MELYIHSPHASQDSGVQLGNNSYKPDIEENTNALSCILFFLLSDFFIIAFIPPYIFLNFCFHVVIYIISNTEGLQHTVTVEYKITTSEYVCMYVVKRSRF